MASESHEKENNARRENLPPPPPLPPSLQRIGPTSIGFGQLSYRNIRKELQFELVQAIEREDLSAVSQLIDKGADLNCIIMFNKTPLTYTIEKEYFTMAMMMVHAGADVNLSEPFARAQRPLHLAVEACSSEMVEFLVNNGADTNGRNGLGLTPLMLASHSGQTALVKLLLAQGADINAADDMGKTALHRAAEGEHPFIVHYLQSEGADICAVDKFGRSALYHSVFFRHVDMVKFLLDLGIYANSCDIHGQSPLQIVMHRTDRQNLKAILSTSVDYHSSKNMIPTAEVHRLVNDEEKETTEGADLEVLQLLTNAGALTDFSRLGTCFCYQPIDDGHDYLNLKPALWYYLALCDCLCSPECSSVMELKIRASELEVWRQKRQSLKWLCRCAIRGHLSKMQPCDVQNSVNTLPLPSALKQFLNLADFYDQYPQFLPHS